MERTSASGREGTSSGPAPWNELEPTLPLVYVAEYTREGAIRYVSEVIRDWTGRDPSDFVAQPGLWYEFVHPDDRARVLELEHQLFDSHEQLDLEYRLVGPDGRPRWVWERNTIVRDSHGRPLCTHGTVVDLSRFGARALGENVLDGHAALVLRHNFLTGLPTRQVLDEQLELALGRAQRIGHVVALLDIDMDRFRGVNDAVGHASGDVVLMQVARRLHACVEPGQLLAYPGADEFLLLVPDLDPAAAEMEVAHLTARIGEALTEPFEAGEHQLHLRASIGYALSPKDGTDSDTLHGAAHAAVASAKAAGRGVAHRYRPDHTQPLRRLSVDYRLRHAIDAGELVAHYQPIIDLRTGQVCAAEALVRWEQEDGSVLGAGEVVPAAEESSLIVDLDVHMINLVCAQARAWREQGRALRLHVNVSARMVRWSGFTRSILQAIVAAGIQPGDIVVELTETSREIEGQGVRQLIELAQAGVSLALDDFGAGHSSLARLRTIPISTIKLDRHLVLAAAGELPESERRGPASCTDCAGRTVLSGLLEMGRALNVAVVVEGVESEPMRELVLELGAPLAQGYLFGRPVPARQFGADLELTARAAL